MGYEIRLSHRDIMHAAEAGMAASNNTYGTDHRVFAWDAILLGWMGQLAVGKYHYQDYSYDVRDWINNGRDLPDGSEVRTTPKKLLTIKESDDSDQMYWMVMPIQDNRLWLLGAVYREDVDHLKTRWKDTNRFTIPYEQYLPHLVDVHEPMPHRIEGINA